MKVLKPQAGFTLLEVLVVVAILGILFGIGALGVLNLRNAAQEGQAVTSAGLRTVRARAIATTSAYRMVLMADRLTLQAETAASCSATVWTRRPVYDVALPEQAMYRNTAWAVCFDSRGTLDAAPAVLTIIDTRNHQLGLQAYLGGSIGRVP